MKKPDLLILIAIWEFISAFVVLIGIAAISVFAFPAVLGMPVNGCSNSLGIQIMQLNGSLLKMHRLMSGSMAKMLK